MDSRMTRTGLGIRPVTSEEWLAPVDGVPETYWDVAKRFLRSNPKAQDPHQQEPTEWAKRLYESGQLPGFVPANGIPVQFHSYEQTPYGVNSRYHQTILPSHEGDKMEEQEQDSIDLALSRDSTIRVSVICTTIAFLAIIAVTNHII